MKRKVSNMLIGLSIALLFSGTLLAQHLPSVVLTFPSTPAIRVHPKINKATLDFKLPDLNDELANLDLKSLAKIEINLHQLKAELESKLADLEEQVSYGFDDLDIISTMKHSQSSVTNSDDYNQASEKTKIISKSYNVDVKDKLSINNQYGRVNVTTWTKNEIKVDIEIKAFEASESKAQDLMESVSISESRSGDLISYKTNFERNSMNFWSRTKNGKEERRGVQVNYTIFMPSKNPLDITNKYGSTTLSDFSGPININSSYGSFTAQKLDNPANRVKVSYGSSSIEDFSSGNLDISYGSLNLNNADRLNADIRYGSAKIGRLTNSGNIDISYTGGFKIDEVDKNVKNLIINSSYSGVTLGLEKDANFNFDVTVSYAGFNFNDDKISITSKTPDDNTKGWNPTKNYKGHIGKGSDSRILIKSNYGGVRFL